LLDLAHRVEILAQLGAVSLAETARHATRLFADGIENAALGLAPGRTRFGAAAVAKQPLEQNPRMRLGVVGRRLVAPGHGVDVEAVARIAGPLRREVDR